MKNNPVIDLPPPKEDVHDFKNSNINYSEVYI